MSFCSLNSVQAWAEYENVKISFHLVLLEWVVKKILSWKVLSLQKTCEIEGESIGEWKRNDFERTKDEQKCLIPYSVSSILGFCIAFQMEAGSLRNLKLYFCVVLAIIAQFFPTFIVTSLQVQ